MQDSSIFREMYAHLKVCVEKFEDKIKGTLLYEPTQEMSVEQQLFVENAKNYHYTEILKHISVVKTQLASIKYHDEKLNYLNGNPERDEYYKSLNNKTRLEEIQYVRKQVERFSTSLNTINQRENKPNRKNHETSMKYLTLWERILEDNKAQNGDMNSTLEKLKVTKRNLSGFSKRKHNKLVSSTFEDILDVDNLPESRKMAQIEEDVEHSGSDDDSEDRFENNFIRNTVNNNTSTLKLNERKTKEYFSDVFENCDNLIEIINRKSVENQARLLARSKSCVSAFGRSYSRDSDRCSLRNSRDDANIAVDFKLKFFEEDIRDSSQLRRCDQGARVNGNIGEKLDTKPRIVNVVYKKKEDRGNGLKEIR